VAAHPSPPCCLVVDDEAGVRTVIRKALERSGYTVLEAASGTDAVKIAERRADDVDLLVTDVRMAGMDGFATASAVSALCPGIPVLFVSGHLDTASALDAALGPGRAFLAKPFHLVDLVATVQRLLAG
jgi:CheY-like chemotaxis protein